jgi:transcriptional regulator with XRE-family HTH domain
MGIMSNMQGDKYSQAVAAILRRDYEASGLSFRIIAERTGLGIATVERVINGKREATAYYLHKLCEVFGTSPGAVLDEADNAG